MNFEWDPEKDRHNQEKHGLGFEEAVAVFDSPVDCLELFDEAHSDFEDRFITIGPIRAGLVLVVWTEREADITRVISARWASPRERDLYGREMERSS